LVFREGHLLFIALTSGGSHPEWVNKVVAADGCELRTGGRIYRTGAARICQDKFRSGIHPLERQVLRLLGTTDFLSLTITH
jgi:hypothetical protein